MPEREPDDPVEDDGADSEAADADATEPDPAEPDPAEPDPAEPDPAESHPVGSDPAGGGQVEDEDAGSEAADADPAGDDPAKSGATDAGTDEDGSQGRAGVVDADTETTGPADPGGQEESVAPDRPASEDAAADPVGEPAVWRAWVIPRRGQLVVAALLGALAFAMTAQINQGEEEDFSSLRGVELVELLKSTDAANERLADQIEELSQTRDELESSTQRSATAERQARERADALAILAGAVGATGPGLTITIDGPEDEVGAAQLLDAIEELRDAGAEAFSINGAARVVAQTYFLDTEDGRVSVGGRDVQRPFTIDAIGDPETMAEAVGIRGGLVDNIEFRGGTISVETEDSLSITALAELSSPEYSRPTSQPE